ncbi:MAG TPA: universal stress protein [Ignavibacteriaceae bacterium]|nr:universal stress protein [Ignavibacteriaceae bacterium]
MTNYKNILVPTDFSDNSIQALEFACILGRQSNSTLHVMHVIEPALHSFRSADGFQQERFVQSRQLDAEEEMRRFLSNISIKDIQIIEALNSGKPYEQILQYSHKAKIDLIIIASHGWTGLTHLITGNVANKVMRYSDIPTICIKSNILTEKDNRNRKSTFAENWVG